MSNVITTAVGESRSDRFGLLDVARRTRLEQTRVVVAGAGLIGSATIANLADLGIGDLVIVDRGRVAPHNLFNQRFGDDDWGRYKGEALAERLRRRHPKLELSFFNCPIERVPVGWLAAGAAVVGCFDNLAARQYLNETAFRLGIEYLDAGVGAGLLGRIDHFVAGGACLECGWDERFYRQLGRETPCDPIGEAVVAPTASPSLLGALVGAKLAVRTMRALLEPSPAESRQWYFDLWNEKQVASVHRRNAKCRFDHRTITARVDLPKPFFAATMGDVLEVVDERYAGRDVELQFRRGVLPSGAFDSDRSIAASRLQSMAATSAAEFRLEPQDWIAAFPREGEPCWLKFPAAMGGPEARDEVS